MQYTVPDPNLQISSYHANKDTLPPFFFFCPFFWQATSNSGVESEGPVSNQSICKFGRPFAFSGRQRYGTIFFFRVTRLPAAQCWFLSTQIFLGGASPPLSSNRWPGRIRRRSGNIYFSRQHLKTHQGHHRLSEPEQVRYVVCVYVRLLT